MDIEKTITFILNTQAKTEAILQAAAERQTQAEARAGRAEDRMTKAEARMNRFDQRMRFYVRAGAKQISEIREIQTRTDLALEKLTHRLDEVTDKLDALIVIVDGVVRRPGSSPSAA